ncbi:hypothetical protein RSK20926_22554 [Roseobacter sp. SK209-2-6]|uniref:COG3904 family protein n=1 Tax=Roseobacter sp. SK209-2-6 TaxID=388739 RepID=UPI0000F3F2B5|nr:hypothetical protein [Roseobacter sp. SK209-2-6]EBA16554.1 hypothetical protein RSK20926_22554 [Roseobacter sp. SK209-2-6]
MNQAVQLPIFVFFALLSIDFALLIFAGRNLLRATDSHQSGSGAMAPVWGSYLAYLLLALLSSSLWWEAWLISNQEPDNIDFEAQRNAEHSARYSLILTPDGRILDFKGEITFGLTRRLKKVLSENPEIETLLLSSAGGLIYEARGAAKLIAEFGLNTEARGLCASACTLLFAAGNRRQIGMDGSLGFHSYQLRHFGGLPQINIEKEQKRDEKYLISRGVSEDFVKKVFETSAEKLWFPSADQLTKAGVTTN